MRTPRPGGEGDDAPPGRLPDAARARFWGYAEEDLLAAAHLPFLATRLMEEGDGAELRWLVGQVGRERLAALLAAHGGRSLSRRSRAFWSRVLGVAPPPPHPLAAELWPLA